MADYTAPGAIRRLPGETFANFSARQKASQAKPKPKRRRAPSARKLAEQQAADRVDGFDRDDIGLSEGKL